MTDDPLPLCLDQLQFRTARLLLRPLHEADIDPRNAASKRVLERLVFRREGLLRERWIVAGKVSDTVLYGLPLRDWQVR